MRRCKFSGSTGEKEKHLNFIPYFRLLTTKGHINLLIDTGANKSYINPEHVNKSKKTNHPSVVTNKNGKFVIDEVVHANFFSKAFNKKLPYYVFRFHKFFDGLIGYENLASMEAKLDSGNNQLIIGDTKYPLSKYFPCSVNFHEQASNMFEICTTVDGTFLVEDELNLTKHIILEPGLYQAKNNKATVHLSKVKHVRAKEIPPFANERFLLNRNESQVQEKLNFPAEHLNREEKRALAKALKPFKDVFFIEGQKLTFTHEIKHRIETNDEKPIHQKTYKYPYHLRTEVSEQIQKMLESGIIRESSSPWTSPIWVVPKKIDKSGKKKYRIVVDYRKLNEKTPADRYPIPEISEILDRLGKAQYFTVLDLASGFHQIEIDSKDIPKTAFNIDHGKFEFVRMPFGLKNAPATFQRLMDSVLRRHLGIRCFVYMDDIIVFSTSLNEHVKDITMVLQTLRDANLKVQCDKSEFLRKEVEFLGHTVTTQGVRPNSKKIEAVKNWPLPKTPKELKSFLGTISYYRRFIPGFAKIAKPLTSMLRGKPKTFEINLDFEKAFETLKNIMCSDLLLHYPNFEEPFILTTDASNYAIGAVLTQMVDGKERPIAYLSRTLTEAEEKYSATSKELLAIYFAAKKFRPYLYGRKFTIYTDHEPLTKEIKLTDATGRVTRQRLYLEQFDFQLVYKKGNQNVVADGLSRIPSAEINLQVLSNECFPNDKMYGPEIVNKFANQIIIRVMSDPTKSPYLMCKIFPGQLRHVFHKINYTEEDLKEILKRYLDPSSSNCIFAPIEIIRKCAEIIREKFNQKLKVHFSNLLLPDLISGPDQEEYIRRCHNFNHRGYKQTYDEVRKSVYFPGMLGKVRTFIKSCEDCKFSKYERRPFRIDISRRVYEKPFENVFIDVYVKETEKFLTLVDSFSKFAQIYKIGNETTDELTETLIEYFRTFGLPKMITCDQAPGFRNPRFRKFLESKGISLHFASNSNSNGIVERFHNTLLEMYLANRQKFADLSLYEGLALTTALYNDATHSTTNMKPREIIFGNCSTLDAAEINLSKLRNIQTARDNIKRNADKHNNKVSETESEKYSNLLNPVLVKGKAKPSPYGNRYRLVDVAEQTTKTITDTRNIKTHKKNVKKV